MMIKDLALACLACAALVAPAFAANEGTAVGVNPDALARIDKTDRVLIAGQTISVGETLVTGHTGQVQIIFADSTRLVVGPDSSLLIETYLMRNDGTAEKLAINALAGSFRFITGHSPKPAYQITTPTAAIAVRGTKFDIIVTPTDTSVMLYEGAVQLCGNGVDCVAVTGRCEVGTASARQANLLTRADPQRPPLALNFRYARFQTPLLAPFRVEGAALCLGSPEQDGPPESLSSGYSSDDGSATSSGSPSQQSGPNTTSTNPTTRN